MKKNYTENLKKIGVALVLLAGQATYSQDINFTFANAMKTNVGVDNYYEVDVMIQTINSTDSFKLGSGQLYFDYNTAAFGVNVKANASFTVTQPNPAYICGQYIDAFAANIYGSFTTNDNTTSRVSWAFSQAFSSSTFTSSNVTATPTKLCHLKFKYIDVNQVPSVAFYSDGIFSDQFFTACGPIAGGPFATADCGFNPGSKILNDTFDSSGVTLSNKENELFVGFSVYPNPTNDKIYINGDVTKLLNVEIYSLTGQRIMDVNENFREINIAKLTSAIYFVKLKTQEKTETIRIVKN
jgi:hypothetical protein